MTNVKLIWLFSVVPYYYYYYYYYSQMHPIVVLHVHQPIQRTIIFAFKYLRRSFNIKILKESRNIIGIWSSSIYKRKHSRKILYRV